VGSVGSEEYDAAVAVLNRLNADVVALNEVNGSADVISAGSLAAAAGYNYTVIGDAGNGSLRNAIFSRYPFTADYVHTPPDLSGDAGANDMTRWMVEARIKLSDTQHVALLVQHWKSGTGNSDEFRRAVESFRMAQAIEDLDTDADYFILVGDVNEELDSVPRTPTYFESLPNGLSSNFELGNDVRSIMLDTGIYNDPFAGLLDPTLTDAVVVDALQLDGTDGTRPASGRRLDYLMISRSLQDLMPVSEVYDDADEGLASDLIKIGAPLVSGTVMSAADHLPVLLEVELP